MVKSEMKESFGSSNRSNDRTRSRGSTQIGPKHRKFTEGKARAREEASKYIGLVDSSEEEEVILPQPPDAKVEAEWKQYMSRKIALSGGRSTAHCCCCKVTKERPP